MKKVLITGASSYVGTHVRQHLEKYPDRYNVDSISVRDDKWRTEDFSIYDSIYHCAGLAHSDVGNVSDEVKAKYYAVNTYLTTDLAKKAKAEGVKQFITVVMAFYHERDTEYEKLKNEMRTFSTERCLQFLNYAVLEYTDNCYFSKRILDLVRKDRLINTVVRENNGLPDRGVNVHNWAELRWVQNHYKSPDYRTVTNLLDRRYAI